MDYKHKIGIVSMYISFAYMKLIRHKCMYMTLAGHQASSESVGTTTAAQNPRVLVFRFRLNLWVIEGIKAYS